MNMKKMSLVRFLVLSIMVHMFKILPYIFLYEIWVRLSILLTGLNFQFDNIIAKLMYAEISELEFDKKWLYLDNKPYEKTTIVEILTTYVRYGFIDKFYLPNEPINEGIRGMITFWKQYTITPLTKWLQKYYLIDIIFFIISIINIITYSI